MINHRAEITEINPSTNTSQTHSLVPRPSTCSLLFTDLLCDKSAKYEMRRKLAALVAGKADTFGQQVLSSSSKKKGKRREGEGLQQRYLLCVDVVKGLHPLGNAWMVRKRMRSATRTNATISLNLRREMRTRVAQKHRPRRSTQQCPTTHWSAPKNR